MATATKVNPNTNSQFIVDSHYIKFFDQYPGPKYLNLKEAYFYSHLIDMMELSVKNTLDRSSKKNFYNLNGRYFYIVARYARIIATPYLPNSKATISKYLKKLQQLGLIVPHRKERRLEIEIPPIRESVNKYLASKGLSPMPARSAKFSDCTLQSSPTELRCKSHSKKATLNNKHSYTSKNEIFAWKNNSAKTFNVNSNDLEPVVKFVELYMKPKDIKPRLREIYYKIIQARNAVSEKYKIDKSLYLFENNYEFQQELSMALHDDFGQIEANIKYDKENPGKKPVTPNQYYYIPWFVSQMEDHFVNWLHAEPKSDNSKAKPNKNDKSRKESANTANTDKKINEKRSDHTVIRDAKGHVKIDQPLPKWARSDYHEKLHPVTDPKELKKLRDMELSNYAEDHHIDINYKAIENVNNSKDTNNNDQKLADGTPIKSIFDKPETNEKPNAEDDSINPFSDTDDPFNDDEAKKSDLIKYFTTYYEDEKEISKHETLHPGVNSIFEPRTRFDGRSVSGLHQEMNLQRSSIDDLRSQLDQSIVFDAENIARSNADKNMNESEQPELETVPPTDDKKNGIYDEDNAPF